MVFILRALFANKPYRRPRKYQMSKFLDSVRLHVRGGTGGTGLPRFGGLGGQGGCVYCVGKEGSDLKNILRDYRSKAVNAGHGEDSRKTKIIGSPGKDVELTVPPGITIYTEEGKVLGTINAEGEKVIVARGGPGGAPDNDFLGHFGQSYHIRLDLKLIADVGLVGFPNAGKSSLLKAISRAKPKVANYPFTTIKPNIGIVSFKDLRKISIADLPGLIEGAHANIGLGHQFLRHVERTKILLFVVDVQGFGLSAKHQFRSCLETILLLNKELELYKPELIEKPAILAVNKMDLDGAKETLERVKECITNIDETLKSIPEELHSVKMVSFDAIIGISALNKPETIEALKQLIRERLDKYADENNPDIVDPSDLFRRNKAIMGERGPTVT